MIKRHTNNRFQTTDLTIQPNFVPYQHYLVSLLIVPLFLRKIFPGVLLEKSAKIIYALGVRGSHCLRLPQPSCYSRFMSSKGHKTSCSMNSTRFRYALHFHSAIATFPRFSAMAVTLERGNTPNQTILCNKSSNIYISRCVIEIYAR